MIKITAIIFSVCVCAFCGAENIPVVAHRGYSAVAPENTMAAYRAAWKNNISYIEIDVYDLKDNNTVCIHDQKLKRVSHGAPDKIITQMTLQEIQQYDVGKWKNIRFAGEKVPLLEDVLAEMPPDSYIFLLRS